ncbi:MAG: HAMP domain-containing histidine kinase [Cytophagales bacterium]|nr:HAMP domain-containing histidine kinase [Cytophagales bacterium]MDW8383881.1 HAMP domain-containing sensor histidine kinase [Flammeovirgaceae bacterium]
MQFKTFKNKLLATYLIFTGIIGVVAWFGYYFFKKSNDVTELADKIFRLMIDTQKAIRAGQDFFQYEAAKEEFLQNGESNYLQLHENTLYYIFESLKEIENTPEIEKFGFMEELGIASSAFIEYHGLFDKIVNKIKERGAKNTGLEGELRKIASKLESFPFMKRESFLLVQRWEKEYLTHQDSLCLKNFYAAFQKLNSDVKKLSSETKKNILPILVEYKTTFDKIVVIDDELGLKSGKGLSNQLRNTIIQIEEAVGIVMDKASLSRQSNNKRLQLTFSRLLVVTIVISIILSYTVASDITRPITQLATMIDVIILRKFDERTPLIEVKSKDEIGQLTANLNLMIQKLREYIKQLSEKSEELSLQNEQLKIVNKKLSESEANLRELNHIKNRFFSIISHDLRGPFNTLRGFLNILSSHAEGFSPSEIKALTAEMLIAVNNVYNLTNNLLQWSLTQTDGIKVNPTEVDLHKAVSETFTILSRQAQEKEITLYNYVPEGEKLYTDPNILDFVIRNLVANAIKFTEIGGWIRVSSHRLENGRLEIQVADNGVGIEPERLQKLFKIEERTSTKGTLNEKGTGLGLILCKEFLQKCNASMSVESTVGKGTTFKILF